MQRLTFNALALVVLCSLLLPGAACKRKKKRPADDEPAGLATMLQAADPRSAVQFIRGFHGVEQGAWRWTQKTFAVTLKPPTGAATNGAALLLKCSIVDPVLQKVGPMTLSAKIGDTQLSPETYTKAGDATYSRDVPAAAFKGDAVTVEFSLDKALPPSDQDIRELGVIVNMVGFEAKQ